MKTIQVTTVYGEQRVVLLDAEGRLRVNTVIQTYRPNLMRHFVCVYLSNDVPIAETYTPPETTNEEAQEELKKLLLLVEAKYGCECVVMRAFV